MPSVNTTFDIPDIAKEITLTIGEGADAVEYSKVVIPEPGPTTTCTDEQVMRVMPYRTEQQFTNPIPDTYDSTIGGAGYQLVNKAHRCSVNTDKIILTHDCAMPGLSIDNGRNWMRLGRNKKTRGLYFDRPQAIISAVNNDERMVAFGTVYNPNATEQYSHLPGVYVSNDGGSNWEQKLNWPYIIAENMYPKYRNHGYGRAQENVLVNDPVNPNFWYLGTEYSTPEPGDPDGRPRSPSVYENIDWTTTTFYRRIMWSADGGETWTNQELKQEHIIDGAFNWWHALVVSPANRDLFACTDTGLYRSTNAKDGGTITFTKQIIDPVLETTDDPLGSGSPTGNFEVFHVACDPVHTNIMYACCRDHAEDRPGPDTNGFEYHGLYKSEDNGINWTRVLYQTNHRLPKDDDAESLSVTLIVDSSFTPDIDLVEPSATRIGPWVMELTPDGESMYLIGGPLAPHWNLHLFKGIKDDGYWDAIRATTSEDYLCYVIDPTDTPPQSKMPGNSRLFVLAGPTVEKKHEAIACGTGQGGQYRALTAEDIRADDPSLTEEEAQELEGYLFVRAYSGWKGENMTTWYRPKHDKTMQFYGMADVQMWTSFNDGDFVTPRPATKPPSKGGQNKAGGIIYAIPSKGRVVTPIGGPNNKGMAVYNRFEDDDYTTELAFHPGMGDGYLEEVYPERFDEYKAKFPHEQESASWRLHKYMFQNPDDVNQLITADMISVDGGYNWDYIPGLFREPLNLINEPDGNSAEVIKVIWQQNGNHIVWAVNGVGPSSRRTALLRATWSVADGWSPWEKLPNAFGVVDGGDAMDISMRMGLTHKGSMTQAVLPSDPDVVYCITTFNSFVTLRPEGSVNGNGHLWKFVYSERNNTDPTVFEFGNGLGGWYEDRSMLDFAYTIDVPDVPPTVDNPTGEIWLDIEGLDVDSNPGVQDGAPIIYVTFGIPGAICTIRRVGDGDWEEISGNIPCSATLKPHLDPDTGEFILSSCEGNYIFPAPLGYERDANIKAIWQTSAEVPVDDSPIESPAP